MTSRTTAASLQSRFLRAVLESMYATFSPNAGPVPRFIASGLCGVAGLLALMANWGGSTLGTLLLASLAYVAGGLRAGYGSLAGLRTGHLDINFLMILAAVVSGALGHWGEGIVLLFLFSLSDALEYYAIERTRRGISALMNLRPDQACVVRDDREFFISIEQVAVGDLIRIRPGQRFPVDGVLTDGQCAADESVVTGEPLPVEKSPGNLIFAGTINTNGSVLVRTTKPASESTISRIVALVESAQEAKAPTQRLIEKWQTPYVWGVLGLTAITILFKWIGTGELAGAVQRGMILLVAASPCAVMLSSPVAVLAAVTRGARCGVLFKGGAYLERLAGVNTIAFDKTGTLTRGRPAVKEITPFGGLDEPAILRLASGLEAHSQHPLALAILAAAKQRELPVPEVSEFASLSGFGVSGRIDGDWVGIGRPELFEQRGIAVPEDAIRRLQQRDGRTSVLMLRADGAGGVIALEDELRPEAAHALALLRQLGVARLIMLTGDQIGPAERVAGAIGLTEIKARLRPEDKLVEVQRLAKLYPIAMVGDGVNDAPALAAATVGVAMGAAGSDVALETADVVLMRSDLRTLAEALHLARHCRETIRTSLIFAFSAIAVLVSLTLMNWMILPIAVVCHEGSTVLAILNGLRLLKQDSVEQHLAKQEGAEFASA